MSDFRGKTVLVTGGRTGIGRACADLFAAKGANVITAQRGVADEHASITADLGDPSAPEAIIDEVIKRTGRLDVLLNNAGIMREGTVEEMSVDEWQQMMAVNLTAPFLLIKYAMPHLRQSGGNIVNIGSIEGVGANPAHPAYCASKAGLHGLTRAIAVDHGKDGVRCNAVAPGWVDTDLNEDFINSMPDPTAFRQQIGDIHPVRRTGVPDEIAQMICWLASDAASFVTGQVHVVDGGRTAQLSLP